MSLAHFATTVPNKLALVVADTGETLTFKELDERSAQLASRLQKYGLERGDKIALLLENGVNFVVAVWAARRAGLVFVPINWHLTQRETCYILKDSAAKALLSSDAMKNLAVASADAAPNINIRLAFGVPPDRFISVEEEVEAAPVQSRVDEIDGALMIYSSGTTGYPKGVLVEPTQQRFDVLTANERFLRDFHGVNERSVCVAPGPLYHAASLSWATLPHKLGATTIVFSRFDAEQMLKAIARYRVTHCQMVPIHFIRMLKLPSAVRGLYDVSSLKRVLHAAAPCPIEVKEQMLDWWGPIIHEYYSGSEGAGYVAATPEEWLAHKGTVGRVVYGGPLRICGEDGHELPPGEIGLVFFANPRKFLYHNDPSKTSDSLNDRGWATLGDMGWLDDDGFLYLADRQSNMIISGGVNIYPQEIEAVLHAHPAVADIAVIGVPDVEFGEQVKAVVELAAGLEPTEGLAAELATYTRERLAGFKVPRTFDFVEKLPRTPAGKLVKREIRKIYWGEKKVVI